MMEENKNANLLCLLLIRQTLWARRSSPKQAEMFHFSRADNHVLQSPPLNLFKNIYLIAFMHTASFWNIIIQWTSHDDLTEK